MNVTTEIRTTRMRFAIVLLLSGLATAWPGGSSAGDATPAPAALLDRVIAAVDGDPILLSDVERRVALGMVEAAQGESQEGLHRRVLDGLIDERIRLHEVGRYGGGRVSVEEIDRQVELIRQRFDDRTAYERELARLGLDEAGLRHLVLRQLRILAHIEERLAPRVFVDLGEIQSYYESELRAEMERREQPLPPLEKVREPIRELLRERQLNAEIAAWTERLRLAADVVSYLERPERPLPPLLERFSGKGKADRAAKENRP